MPPKNEPAEEPVSLFNSIKNAIARRSEIIKQHEADYATAVQEKDDAIAARDNMTRQRDEATEAENQAIKARDSAEGALAAVLDRADKAEGQLAEIGYQLGVGAASGE